MSGARIPSSPEGPAHFRDPAWAHAETGLPSSDSPVTRQLPPRPPPESDSSNVWLVIRAESWQQLKVVALAVLGPASHQLGLCYGLAEGGWGIISGLLDLLKMIVLEGLYQQAHQAWSWNPFEWPDYLEGRTADYFLHAHLEAAHRQFTGLMQQLALAVKDPGTFFGAVWDSEVQSYAAKWQRYKWLIGHRTLTNEFEAGRLEGGVLLEVILLLATVVDGVGLAIKGAKALGEIPELVRLAKTVRSAEEAKAALAARQLEKLRSGTSALGDADGAAAQGSHVAPPLAAAKPGAKDVYIDPNKYPAAAGHVADAQAAGQPDVLTVDRAGAADRRRQAIAGVPTQAGTDRDEYPPAVTAEGGSGASVRRIPSSDNRGAGGSLGQQIRSVPDGGTIRIVPKPNPEQEQ
jgi:hypothetical protein